MLWTFLGGLVDISCIGDYLQVLFEQFSYILVHQHYIQPNISRNLKKYKIGQETPSRRELYLLKAPGNVFPMLELSVNIQYKHHIFNQKTHKLFKY